jgi:hypothetical protein
MEAMEKILQVVWKRRALGMVCVLWLLIFMLFEAYSAAATALDRNGSFPSWEPVLGWALFILPAALLASLFLFHRRHPRLGFYLVVGNLGLYASFMVFESIVSRTTPGSHQATWQVEGIWAMFFIAALLAAHFLKTRAHTLCS